jgi:hypothetical protein
VSERGSLTGGHQLAGQARGGMEVLSHR